MLNRLVQDGLSRKLPRLVLITEQPNPGIDEVLYINGDYTNIETLQQAAVGDASMCLIFAEKRPGENDHIVDMRTIFTAYNINSLSQERKIHIISEIVNQHHMDIVRSTIDVEEIILSETIDATMIVSSLLHPHVFRLLYELVNQGGKVLHEVTPLELGFKEEMLTYRDILRMGIDLDFTFIGLIQTTSHTPILSPPADTPVFHKDRIIFIDDPGFSLKERLNG